MAITTATVPRTPGESHHTGWDKALEQALDQMSNDFPAGNHTVEVHFHLDVDVSSPGNIGFYKVTLSN